MSFGFDCCCLNDYAIWTRIVPAGDNRQITADVYFNNILVNKNQIINGSFFGFMLATTNAILLADASPCFTGNGTVNNQQPGALVPQSPIVDNIGQPIFNLLPNLHIPGLNTVTLKNVSEVFLSQFPLQLIAWQLQDQHINVNPLANKWKILSVISYTAIDQFQLSISFNILQNGNVG